MLLLASSPALSTVQVLASSTFAPIGFVFPTDGRGEESINQDLQYAWKEVRRWHRSFSVLCDEAPDEDILHAFHLLFASLFILLSDTSGDAIDRSVRLAMQPLREWAGVVIRTNDEYGDFMRNVRVSMLELHRVCQDIGVSEISSKQAAEIKTNIDEVAIFLKLTMPKPEPEAQAAAEHITHIVDTSHQVKKGFIARLVGRMRGNR